MSKNDKRLIIVSSAKGGVGKTMEACGQVDFFRRRLKDKLFASDADGEVGGLLQLYGEVNADTSELVVPQDGKRGVHFFDVKKPNEIELMFDGIDSGCDRVLIDMPGGSFATLSAINDQFAFFQVAKNAGYSITLVDVITPMTASLRTVTTMIDLFQNSGANFLVVRNKFFGPYEDDWLLWDESGAKERLKDVGGIVIDLPAMRMRTLSQIDKMCLQFSAAITSNNLKTADKSVAFKWLQDFDAEMEKAAKFL